MLAMARFLSLSALFIFVVVRASAQEPSWRTDYRSARQEAREKGLPLLVDFGTANCFWCRKLETTTFRDPSVAALLKEQFVPLRIDADRDPALAQHLRIQSYPTLVLAAPDGKILAFIEGYLEAPKLLPHLRAAVAATLPTPEWMVRDFQEASKAVALGDNAQAIVLFRRILEDGKERPVQLKAREHLATLEAQADNRLAHAKRMEDQGQSLEAMETFVEILRKYPGTAAATEAKNLLGAAPGQLLSREKPRERRAAELLAEARTFLKSRDFCQCLERCDTLRNVYAGTPESDEAEKMAALIRDNPEWLADACQRMSERIAAMHLALAEAWLKKGNRSEAVTALERIEKLAPSSVAATSARNKLAEIQGTPGVPANFKQP
ncbi:MAG: thioredoxin family protein [Gemmataceae bacterium]|nr:thioredoxin family protein [Gemmataceae bacterium]